MLWCQNSAINDIRNQTFKLLQRNTAASRETDLWKNTLASNFLTYRLKTKKNYIQLKSSLIPSVLLSLPLSFLLLTLHRFTGSVYLLIHVYMFTTRCVSPWASQVKWKSFSPVRLFATPWSIQSMEFSRPEYWSGEPNPGTEPTCI